MEVKHISARLVGMPICGQLHPFTYPPGSAGVKAVTSGPQSRPSGWGAVRLILALSTFVLSYVQTLQFNFQKQSYFPASQLLESTSQPEMLIEFKVAMAT